MKNLIGFLSVAFIGCTAFGGEWPQFMGPNRDHVSTETDWAAPENGPNIVWRAKVGVGYSGISVAGGKAITLGHNGKAKTGGEETVWCFDARSGELLWKKTYPARLIPTFHKGGPNAAPTIAGQTVYTLSKDGLLHALDTGSGDVRWFNDKLRKSVPTRWGFASAPRLEHGLLWLHANGPYGFSPQTGELVKHVDPESIKPGYSSTAFFTHGGNNLMAAMTGDAMVIYDTAEPKLILKHPFKIQYHLHAVTPLITEGPGGTRDIFISCANEGGRCEKLRFDGEKLTRLWGHTKMRNFMNNCVLVDGHLYG
ncbi:MAG: PQQ-binding-like beta-propeller repeat protein, partial [Phycisphaeraceae bacterium]|nr:PQQ-binding-like beta-propeller repeat protein [Phycisphaeraceae bacterium]